LLENKQIKLNDDHILPTFEKKKVKSILNIMHVYDH